MALQPRNPQLSGIASVYWWNVSVTILGRDAMVMVQNSDGSFST